MRIGEEKGWRVTEDRKGVEDEDRRGEGIGMEDKDRGGEKGK